MKRYFVIALLLQLTCAAATSLAQIESGSGWQQSFKAGVIDASTGEPIGGTEIIHLVAHKGRLYAGNGYWMDTRAATKQIVPSFCCGARSATPFRRLRFRS